MGAAVAAASSRSPRSPSSVGVAVLREGSEVVLFLYGIFASGGTSTLGMLVGGAARARRRRGAVGADVSRPADRPGAPLFAVTTGLITLLAAGLAAQSRVLPSAGRLSRGAHHDGVGHVLAVARGQPGRAAPAHAHRLHRPAERRAACRLCATVAVIVGLMRWKGAESAPGAKAQASPATRQS